MNEMKRVRKKGRRQQHMSHPRSTRMYAVARDTLNKMQSLPEIVKNRSAHFISSLNQYCPISVLAPVSLTFINKAQ